MNRAAVEKIARAILYEGYLLYPYRRSAIKNRMRWNFGVLYPEAWSAAQTGSDRSRFVMEVIATAGAAAALHAEVRFLHLEQAEGGETARERAVETGAMLLQEIGASPWKQPFSFPGSDCSEQVEGEIELSAAPVGDEVWRIALTVRNTAPLAEPVREAALPRSLISAHAVLGIGDGEFVSMTDPPAHLRDAVQACRNQGVWPVLAGEPGSHDTMLGSPIILEDYPRIAPESAGDLFDSTEIDEILTLRVLTLTDAEKSEIRAGGDEGKRLLESAESLPPEHLMRLHGVIRELRPAASTFHKGDRVRLKPSRCADAFDLVLAGKIAVIESIERDFEDNVHLAVVLEDDPGRDLGELRQVGHRFFFSPAEVEPIVG
jgi:hypothetical protein